MKVNLLRNAPDDAMNGFLNIDPFADGKDCRKQGDLADLSFFVEDAEATEIVARDILDFYDKSLWERTLDGWIKKLRHGGKIVVGGVDIYEVSKAVSNYSISTADANRLLHGEQDAPWNFRKTNATLFDMTGLLESKGLKVMKKRMSEFHYIVEAVRP